MTRPIYFAALITFAACSPKEENVFVPSGAPDSGVVVEENDDASTPLPDANDGLPDSDVVVPDAGTIPDMGVPPGPDSGVPPVQNEWEQLTDYSGGLFRFIGNNNGNSYLLGRNLNDRVFSLYVVNSTGTPEKRGLAVDPANDPLNLPTGKVGELGANIIWATDQYGIVVSSDGGATFRVELPWLDGTVGVNGNGTYGRVLDAWPITDRYCVQREVTPWVNFRYINDERRVEVRCLDLAHVWSVETTTIAEGIHHFTPFGEDLYAFTSPIYNMTNPPKFCHSPDLGRTWDCFPDLLGQAKLHQLSTGRLILEHYVDAPNGTETEYWGSDNFGETWQLVLHIPFFLTDTTVVGDKIHGFIHSGGDEVSNLYVVDLQNARYDTYARPTLAQLTWVDPFENHGVLCFADNRGVHAFDEANNRFLDIPLETMPSYELELDRQGTIWTIDGNLTLRRRLAGNTQWDEVFFVNPNWSDLSTAINMARVEDWMFFGGSHGELFRIDASTTSTIPTEDLTYISDTQGYGAAVLAGHGQNLFAAAGGGSDVTETGQQILFGGGLHMKDVTTGAWRDLTIGLPMRVNGNARADAIVGAIYAGDGALVVATHQSVYSSLNLNPTWAPVSGIPSFDATIDRTRIAGNGTKVLVARASGALYYSSDARTFTQVSSNLPFGSVRDLAADGDVFFALIDPVGVWSSSDEGRTWIQVGTLPSGVSFPDTTFSLDVDAAELVVGSRGGIWRVSR